jgi:melibiase-like protein
VGRGIVIAVAALAAAMFGSATAEAEVVRAGPVRAEVTADGVSLGNGLVERSWDRHRFATTALVDRRGQDRRWGERRRDFTLWAGGVEISSEDFDAESVRVERLRGGGLRLTMDLGSPTHLLTVRRVVEAYPGIAGFQTRTSVQSPVPMPLSGATLDEAAVGRAAPTLNAFRAGADWREPGWSGPPLFTGDPHAGTWRDTRTAGAGEGLSGPGQWLSLEDGGRSLFMVMERNDFPSSRASYDGSVASLRLDYSRDVIDLGPLEEQVHLENPSDGPGRQRMLEPGKELALEPAFVGFGNGDGDEAWQYHRYLTGPRGARYRHDVVFNSNGTDDNRISTGAKDDMDLATVKQVAPSARRLGIETFVLDDGWQAISGDWQPDSPQHPEPRYDGSPDSKFKPRFPDDTFKAVRDAIAPMRLGLWMSPMSFNPKSQAYRDHPDWACLPVGDATALATALDPESGSNEPGIGLWSPKAIPHIESRIRDAVENWGVAYFKFDFLVWLDCAGEGDLYAYKDAFVGMIDRLRRDYPRVTFQIDETNDYRLFPFESVARGPSWFQNGTPSPDRLLHNVWDLSPWVPAYSLGQHFLGGSSWHDYPVGTLMAAALPSHLTFFSDLRSLPAEIIDQAAPWISFYKRHRSLFDGVTYPLLADPVEKGWTALQVWDPQKGRGALLTFRQDSDDATRTVPLRNVPPGRTFDLIRAPDGALVGTVTSAQLSQGIDVSLPDKRGAQVLGIVPASG